MYNEIDNAWPDKPEDAEALEAYAKYLYEDPLENEPDEEDVVVQETY